MSTYNRIYVTPSHTKKIFGNMRRVGKGFSGRETPLFPTMMVQAQEEMGKDDAINEAMDGSLERAATIASSLKAEQDSGNINKTQSKATLNEPSFIGTISGSGPRCQETMRDTIAQTRVLDLENTKTTQALENESLKKRVKKLKKKQRGVCFTEVPLKEVNVAAVTATTATIDNITLAKALTELKSAKPKVKVQDKGKGKMVEPEPMKKLSKKDQLMLDEELAFKLQAEEEEEEEGKEEERLAIEKSKQIKEVNIAWDDIQAKINADYLLAQRLQTKEADGNSQMYLTFSKMLKIIDREDLEVLWRLVKARFEKIKPVDYMDN
nr:hypothetical protein [Tanacetum cinerariifolium]